MEVRDLDPSVTMLALMSGLLKNDIKRSLTKTYPRDFADMLAWTEKYARTEDASVEEEIPITSILGGAMRV